jgi:EAL domain-containing protein (putative c-di-GMP-specific phosphodiesterase class I)
VAPGDLVIEVTESALVRDIDATVRRLHQLKDLGVEVAIDDFGTGYSSLDHLRRFPVDVLKIDKSFVDGITRGSEEASFAEAIIRLADQLHLRTVAEGVETREQATTLVGLGAHSAQGYLYSRPVPADVMGDLLTRSSLGVDRLLAVPAESPSLAVSA